MEGFAERLQSLIGEMSVSAFARKVGLSEALIRKYLKGAEPGLARANQIAMGANCSLEWLATGCGYLYRQAEVVDREALAAADYSAMTPTGRCAPSWSRSATKWAPRLSSRWSTLG